jgi:3'-5' exoribonuclease 1
VNIIVFDLEATCWRGRPPKGYNEIIEIGAYKINGFGEIIGQFSSFVKPIINPILSGFCKELTGIQQSDVDKSKTFDRVILDFLNWIEEDGEDYLLISWGEQDVKFFKSDCELHKIEDGWINRCLNAKTYYKKLSGIGRQLGLKSALAYEGLEFDGTAHRAITDAYNLSKIVIRYIDEWPS